MSHLLFKPVWVRDGKMSLYSQTQIKKEPMLFSADYKYAKRKGGPITKEFLKHLDPKKEWVIDSRVHMLMPGWYPCIPGWHHDDIPRTRSDGQPNYKQNVQKLDYYADHVMTVVGDASLTEFLAEGILLPYIPVGKVFYKEWNEMINKHLLKYKDKVAKVNDGDVIRFESYAFHRGMPATKSGWRFFIRASTNTERPVLNEMRTQVQVYMSDLEGGW